MAEIRPSFCVLEDSVTQAGLPLHKVLEGDAIAAKNALAALVAKDPSNQFAYLSVNAAGELIVNGEGEDVAIVGGEGNADAPSGSFTDIATIVTTAGAVYKNIDFMASCFRETICEIVAIDDVGVTDVETELAKFRIGPGQFTKAHLLKKKYTAGVIGVQNLVLRAENQNATSEVSGSIGADEVQ